MQVHEIVDERMAMFKKQVKQLNLTQMPRSLKSSLPRQLFLLLLLGIVSLVYIKDIKYVRKVSITIPFGTAQAAVSVSQRQFVVFSKVGSQNADRDFLVPTASGVVTMQMLIRGGLFEILNVTGFRMQMTVDGQPFGTPIDITSLPINLSWDSRTVPDGDHVISATILESPSSAPNLYFFPQIIVVDNNAGPITGVQRVPVCPPWISEIGLGVFKGAGSSCDYVTYPGAIPPLQGHPQPIVPGIAFTTRLAPSELYAERPVPMLSLFAKNQHFFQTKEGHVVALPFNTHGGDKYEKAALFVDHQPFSDGPRNVGYVTGYINGAVDPLSEGLYFVEQGEKRGRIGKISLDGTISTIAGYRTKAGFLPYVPNDPTIPETTRDNQYERIGNFIDGPIGFRRPMDIAIDPRNSDILYIADSANNRIAKVDASFIPARVSTYAGSLTGQAGLRNGIGTDALFNEPFSIAMAKDGTMYVADRSNSLIRQIDQNQNVTTLVGQGYTSVPSEASLQDADRATTRATQMKNGDFSVASIIYPFVIRLDSQQNIILGENFLGTIRKINLQTRMVEGPLRIPQASPQWIWLDVDREGTFGPKDDIIFAATSGAGGNNYITRFPADGSVEQLVFKGSLHFDGRLNQSQPPHYPWMLALGKGALWSNGWGADGVTRVRKALPGDRTDDNNQLYNNYAKSGEVIYETGTATGFPWGSRPSFELQHGRYGWSQFGMQPNFDDLASVSDTDLTTMIQSGWGSGIPRPEITGNDLRDLLYYIRRNSLPSIRSGANLLGPVASDTTAPIISSITATEISGGMRFTWTTNEPTLGVVQFDANGGFIVISFGLPVTLYTHWSDIESAYTTTHSATINTLVPGRQYHYIVTARDNAGNLTNTPDATFTFTGGLPDLTPPLRSRGAPSGVLAADTTSTTLSLTTDEPGTCKYGTVVSTSYAALPNTFTTTGGTAHSQSLTGLMNGSNYTYYVRCQDIAGNPNPDDFVITFSVANPSASFDFSLATSGDKTVTQGQSVGNAITASLLSGAAQSVSFTTSGLPAGATAVYSSTSCLPACSTTLTIQANTTTPTGNFPITVTGAAGTLTHTTSFVLTVSNAGADTTPPTVQIGTLEVGPRGSSGGDNVITTPVSGTFVLLAVASDNVGVAGVQFKIDGNVLGAEQTTSPYVLRWDTRTTTPGTHVLTAVARDSAGNQGTSEKITVTVVATVPDIIPPSVTTNLKATAVAATQVNLTWTASTDNMRVDHYEIVRDGSVRATTASTNYQDIGLVPASVHTYAIQAVDTSGNHSTASSAVSVTTLGTSSNPIDALTPGQWYQVPDSHLSDVGFIWPAGVEIGNGLSAIIANWSGGAYDTTRDRLIIWGGGHLGYAGNEIYAFDVNTLRWERVTDPSLHTDPLGVLSKTGEYPDANVNPDPSQPRSPHSYDYIQYIPSIDKFCSFGIVAGFPGALSPRTHCFDFNSKQWERKNDALAFGGSFSAYDSTTGYIWAHGTSNGNSPFLAEWDPSRDVWTQRSNNYGPADYYMTAAIDTKRHKLVAVGAGKIYAYDLTALGLIPVVPLTTTGDTTIVNPKSPGFEYDSIIDKFVAWSGGADVYTLDPDTWKWTRLTPTDTNTVIPTDATLSGTYGRFRYIPSKNAFVVVNSVNENVYIYKLSSGTGTPPHPPAPDTTPPTVSVSAPTSGATLSGTNVTISANASDPVVSGQTTSGIAGVQFQLDGVNLQMEDTTSPYGITWDTTTTTNGSHTLSAIARDGAGNRTTASESVTVSNAVSTPRFRIGDRVRVTTALLNIHSTPSLSGAVLGMQSLDAQGTVIGGPATADGYTWWQVDFDTGVDGWAAENWLAPGTPRTSIPIVTIVSPTPDQQLIGTSLGVSYQESGDLTGVDHVHLQLDSNPEVRDLDNDGRYTFTNVAPGSHTLLVYLAHADHSRFLNPEAQARITFVSTIFSEADQGFPIKAIKSGNWSDPSIWEGGVLPTSQNAATIGSGITLTYDMPYNDNNGAEVRSIIVKNNGTLKFSRALSTRLDLDKNLIIRDGGILDMGTPTDPIPATINTFIGFNVNNDRFFVGNTVAGSDPMMPDFHPEDNGLWVFGANSRITIHGASKTKVWTRLSQDVVAGASTIAMVDAPQGWRIGDTILLAPTSFNPHQEEIRVITAITGNTLTLDKPLAFTHSGSLFGYNPSTQTRRAIQNVADILNNEVLLDLRGAVALLTQNVTIASNLVTPSSPNHRAHTAFMMGAVGSVQYAEFRDLGPRAILGRYPLHLHKMGVIPGGFLVEGASIWSSIADPTNKWLTIHTTSGVTVRQTVGFNAQGRGYYLEDANETDNTLEDNLGVLTYSPEELPNNKLQAAVPGIEPITGSAVFWLRMGNTFRNNVAAGAQSNVAGFTLSPSRLPAIPATVFTGNGARSNATGLSYVGGSAMNAVTANGAFIRNAVGISAEPAVSPTTQASLFVENVDQPANDAAYALRLPGIFSGNTYVIGALPSPYIILINPTPNQTITDSTVMVSYTKANMTGNEHLHLTLDSNPEVRDTAFTGSYTFTNVPAGIHTLTGYLADNATHAKIAGTDVAVSFVTTPVSLSSLQISALSVSSTQTSATLTWTTNVPASSRVYYLGDKLRKSGGEGDTSPRATSHTVTLTNLISCASYRYAVSSKDANGNESRSSISDFTTKGCLGEAAVLSHAEKDIVSQTKDSLALTNANGTGISISLPQTALSQDSTVEIQRLDQANIPTAAPLPSSQYRIVGSNVYELKALVDPSTVLTTFPSAITLTVTYDPADIKGLDITTLKLYSWDGATWTPAQNCIVNQSAYTLTCTTSHFTTFILMGTLDTTPPNQITDLSSTNLTQTSADLSWTAPGDNNTQGTAASYDLRYAPQASFSFATATHATGAPTPQPAGTKETYTLIGLAPNTAYSVALTATDPAGNPSTPSTIISFTTLATPTPTPTPAPSGGGGGGGGGGGVIIFDTTPPGQVTNVVVNALDRRVTLTWKNPQDADYVRTRIVRKDTSYPVSLTDGMAVFEDNKETFTDTLLENGKTYYYSFFTLDRVPNASLAVRISATPQSSPPTTSITQQQSPSPPSLQPSLPEGLHEGDLIRGPDGIKVYLINAYLFKRHIFSPQVFAMYGQFKWNSIKKVTQQTLDLFKTSDFYQALQDPNVFLLEEVDEQKGIAQKHHLAITGEEFTSLGYDWHQVFTINEKERAFYQEDIPYDKEDLLIPFKRQILVKTSQSPTVYYISKRGIKKPIVSPDVFLSYGNKWENVITIPQEELDAYPIFQAILLDKGDGKVYVLEGGKKRWIKTLDTFMRLQLKWKKVITVNAFEFNSYPQGEGIE